MNILLRIVAPAALAGLLFSSQATAGFVPFNERLTYQGRLMNAGEPYSGTIEMEFRLYADDTGGLQVGDTWTTAVTAVDGLFMTEMYFGSSVTWNADRYLEVTVDGTALDTLQRITTVPTALYAYDGDGEAGPWVVAGSNIHFPDGNVGIGTASPGTRLHVIGDSGNAILGVSTVASGFFYGVQGSTSASAGAGVYGVASGVGGSAVLGLAQGVNGYGVQGTSQGTFGSAVLGNASATSGETRGIHGHVASPDGHAAYFTGADGSVNYFQRRVGVGTDTPSAMLHVVNPLPPTTQAFRVTNGGNPALVVSSNNGVTIGSLLVPPDNGLRVHGNTVLNGTAALVTLGTAGTTQLCRNTVNMIATCSSSARYKQDIHTLDNAGALIERLRAVRYRWTDSGMEDLGLVAEEVAAIEPRLVTFNAAGDIEGVKYDRLAALLIAAWQEQQRELGAELAAVHTAMQRLQQEHEARLAALEGWLPELRQTVMESAP